MHTQSSKCLLQDSNFEFIGKLVAKGAVVKPAVVQIQILRFTFLVLGMFHICTLEDSVTVERKSSQTLDSTVRTYVHGPYIAIYCNRLIHSLKQECMLIQLAIIILYSRKYWRALNLVVLPQMMFLIWRLTGMPPNCQIFQLYGNP